VQTPVRYRCGTNELTSRVRARSIRHHADDVLPFREKVQQEWRTRVTIRRSTRSAEGGRRAPWRRLGTPRSDSLRGPIPRRNQEVHLAGDGAAADGEL
jgi:hypothetical protein